MSGEWISVEDRVPEKIGEKCIVFGIGGRGPLRTVAVYEYSYDGSVLEWVDPYGTEISDIVTHWMPWPEDPE